MFKLCGIIAKFLVRFLKNCKRILGIDPGLCHTGWGVIDIKGNMLTPVAHGVISSKADEMAMRLNEIFKGISDVIGMYSPDEAAVEEVFLNKNPGSTLKLGMARGVALLAPAHFGLPVGEYSANKVKKSVVGVGHATKEQVSHMVCILLPKAAPVKLDAADALAVAICHAHHIGAPV